MKMACKNRAANLSLPAQKSVKYLSTKGEKNAGRLKKFQLFYPWYLPCYFGIVLFKNDFIIFKIGGCYVNSKKKYELV